MEKIEKIIHSKKFKHGFFVAFIVAMTAWATFRFATIASENARDVYNIARVYQTDGATVETLIAEIKSGTLYEPLSVKDNRAYVSASRAQALEAGQHVGSGTIKSVSRRLDLNTGMYVVRTTDVNDGLQFAEFTSDGIFVPLYAIKNNQVFVAENGVAVPRNVVVKYQDSENAMISEGLNQGDVVILSTINAGEKVKLKN